MRYALAFALAAVIPVFVGGSPQQSASSDDSLIRIYVFTQSSHDGYVDPDAQQRTDSVKDLRHSFDDSGKRKILRVVDTPDNADIRIEITARANALIASSTVLGNAVIQNSRQTVYGIMSTGTYKAAVAGQSDGRVFGAWSRAADQVADAVEKWIRPNVQRLLADRIKRDRMTFSG